MATQWAVRRGRYFIFLIEGSSVRICHVVLSFIPAQGLIGSLGYLWFLLQRVRFRHPTLWQLEPLKGKSALRWMPPPLTRKVAQGDQPPPLALSKVSSAQQDGSGLPCLQMCLKRGEALPSSPKMISFTWNQILKSFHKSPIKTCLCHFLNVKHNLMSYWSTVSTST